MHLNARMLALMLTTIGFVAVFTLMRSLPNTHTTRHCTYPTRAQAYGSEVSHDDDGVNGTLTIGLVISSYGDDITWITSSLFDHITHFYVYEKRDGHHHASSITNNARVTITHLANHGREADSYLYHMIHYYDQLEHRMVYTQGHWSQPEHAPYLPYYIRSDIISLFQFMYLAQRPCIVLRPSGMCALAYAPCASTQLSAAHARHR